MQTPPVINDTVLGRYSINCDPLFKGFAILTWIVYVVVDAVVVDVGVTVPLIILPGVVVIVVEVVA